MQVGDVRAAARLGDRERADLLAREHRGQHARLQFRAADRAIGGAPIVWENRLGMHAADAGERISSARITMR